MNFQMEATKVLVICWRAKGHDATRIYQKLSTRLGHTLLTYSMITDWLRKLERGNDITPRASCRGRLLDGRIDALITSALEPCPFHSVRTLCSAIKHPRTTVWRHLHAAGFVVRNLRLVPPNSLLLQKRNALEWQSNSNKCFNPPNIAPGGLF
jgi:hypothetical protein